MSVVDKRKTAYSINPYPSLSYITIIIIDQEKLDSEINDIRRRLVSKVEQLNRSSKGIDLELFNIEGFELRGMSGEELSRMSRK